MGTTDPTTGVPQCYRHPGRETYIRCQRCDQPICPDCMIAAAVGHQCPTCVAEGRRATRSGRTAYGGLRSDNPALTSTVLIALNVAVWLAVTATGGLRSRVLDFVALQPAGVCQTGRFLRPGVGTDACAAVGGTWVPGVADGAVWQVLTGAFTHLSVLHIGFNMLAVWFLGPQLEQMLGRSRFLAIYLLSALGGSVAVLWLSAPYSTTIGASGAVFGLLGALLVIALKVRAPVQTLLVWIGLNVAISVVGGSAISWQGHLGGFLTGVALTVAVVYAPRERRTPVQVATLATAGLVLGALVAARMATL